MISLLRWDFCKVECLKVARDKHSGVNKNSDKLPKSKVHCYSEANRI
jgi:hypothetical protein